MRRLGKYLADKEPPPATRLSAEKAVGLAVLAADREGSVLDPPISAWPDNDSDYAAKGRLVWTIMSNANHLRGGHVRVIIDDATGETVAVHVLPR